MSELAPPVASFCFQCGKRVDKNRDKCWYCGATTRRWIRTAKRCPFCGEQIRSEAIKCRHCGEFLDGRPAGQPQGPMIFIVDKDFLRSGRDVSLMAGQPVPPEIARVLDRKTVEAIETNQPAKIQSPAVHALPAPVGSEAGDVIDVEPLPARYEEDSGAGGTGNLPARAGEAQAPAKGLAKAGGMLAHRAAQRKSAARDEAINVEAHDQYRICAQCQTEIFTSDNYCYHCGWQYHKTELDRRYERRVRRHWLGDLMFLAAMLMLAGLVTSRLGVYPLSQSVEWALTGATCAASLVALTRTQRFKRRLMALLVGGAAVYLTFFM